MRDPNVPPFQDPEAKLEPSALIEEFLHKHGCDLTALALPGACESGRQIAS